MEQNCEFKYDFVIATIADYLPRPGTGTDQYHTVQNSEKIEDVLIVNALVERGVPAQRVTRAAWDDETFDWRCARVVVVRTVWNYTKKANLFAQWLKSLTTCVRVVNDVRVMLWNMHKSYLVTLRDEHGVNIPPTVIVRQEAAPAARTLAEVVRDAGWDGREVVFKPAISASALDCHLVHAGEYDSAQGAFASLVSAGDVLVQEFMKKIGTDGEISVIYFGGKLSHAIRKTPKAKDYRVQGEYGGTAQALQAVDEDLQRFCEGALAGAAAHLNLQAHEQNLFARVDTVRDNDGNISLMELELIDCYLFLPHAHPQAAGMFADLLLKECPLPAQNGTQESQ